MSASQTLPPVLTRPGLKRLLSLTMLFPLPPIPSTTSRPPCYSNPPSQTNRVVAYASISVTLCGASGQSARDVPKAKYQARASRETRGDVYSAGTPADHCCATLPALTLPPIPLELSEQPRQPQPWPLILRRSVHNRR